MYSVSDYLWMVADTARVAAYAGALRAAITPGARVVEIGAGFGFFSVLAAQAGAAHVDAVDPNPAILLGPRLAAANGCVERIVFHQRTAAEVRLEHRADVLVLDLRGPTPFGRRSLEVLIEARRRLLRPGGHIIARRDDVFVAPVRTPEVFKREVHAAHQQQGIDLGPVERIAYDNPIRCPIQPGDLLAPGERWIRLDYLDVDRTDASGTAAWTFDEPTGVDGLGLWFESDVGFGYSLSTAPGSSVSAYKQMFIPFRGSVKAEGVLRVELAVRQAADENVWSWRAWSAPYAGAPERLVVDQNSLSAIVIDPACLARRGSGSATAGVLPYGAGGERT